MAHPHLISAHCLARVASLPTAVSTIRLARSGSVEMPHPATVVMLAAAMKMDH